jgi:hypothetical protein
MATVASVVADHESLSDTDEVLAAKQIMANNLNDQQFAEVLAYGLVNSDNTKLSSIANLVYGICGYDLIIQRTELIPSTTERVLIAKANGGFPRVPITPRV